MGEPASLLDTFEMIVALSHECERCMPNATCYLTGSRASAVFDASSDIDLVVALPQPPDRLEREKIVSTMARSMRALRARFGEDAPLSVPKIATWNDLQRLYELHPIVYGFRFFDEAKLLYGKERRPSKWRLGDPESARLAKATYTALLHRLVVMAGPERSRTRVGSKYLGRLFASHWYSLRAEWFSSSSVLLALLDNEYAGPFRKFRESLDETGLAARRIDVNVETLAFLAEHFAQLCIDDSDDDDNYCLESKGNERWLPSSRDGLIGSGWYVAPNLSTSRATLLNKLSSSDGICSEAFARLIARLSSSTLRQRQMRMQLRAGLCNKEIDFELCDDARSTSKELTKVQRYLDMLSAIFPQGHRNHESIVGFEKRLRFISEQDWQKQAQLLRQYWRPFVSDIEVEPSEG